MTEHQDKRNSWAKSLRALADCLEDGEIGFMVLILGDETGTRSIVDCFDEDHREFIDHLTSPMGVVGGEFE